MSKFFSHCIEIIIPLNFLCSKLQFGSINLSDGAILSAKLLNFSKKIFLTVFPTAIFQVAMTGKMNSP